ncbi:MAG: hypothetical protein WCX16_06615, partial [Candidatus Omnitrophota bacterium]
PQHRYLRLYQNNLLSQTIYLEERLGVRAYSFSSSLAVVSSPVGFSSPMGSSAVSSPLGSIGALLTGSSSLVSASSPVGFSSPMGSSAISSPLGSVGTSSMGSSPLSSSSLVSVSSPMGSSAMSSPLGSVGTSSTGSSPLSSSSLVSAFSSVGFSSPMGSSAISSPLGSVGTSSTGSSPLSSSSLVSAFSSVGFSSSLGTSAMSSPLGSFGTSPMGSSSLGFSSSSVGQGTQGFELGTGLPGGLVLEPSFGGFDGIDASLSLNGKSMRTRGDLLNKKYKGQRILGKGVGEYGAKNRFIQKILTQGSIPQKSNNNFQAGIPGFIFSPSIADAELSHFNIEKIRRDSKRSLNFAKKEEVKKEECEISTQKARLLIRYLEGADYAEKISNKKGHDLALTKQARSSIVKRSGLIKRQDVYQVLKKSQQEKKLETYLLQIKERSKDLEENDAQNEFSGIARDADPLNVMTFEDTFKSTFLRQKQEQLFQRGKPKPVQESLDSSAETLCESTLDLYAETAKRRFRPFIPERFYRKMVLGSGSTAVVRLNALIYPWRIQDCPFCDFAL